MTCSAAPRLAYGSITQSSSTLANYTCDTGYSMQGSPYIECVNGVWDMTDYPICLVSLEQYSDASMSYYADSNTTTANSTAEFPDWFVYGMMGSGGLALPVVVFCLLACCHMCGCYSGPVVAVGGRYQYSNRKWYSLFSWCDFMVKGKVCRKIRQMNKSKAIGPDSVDIEDGTSQPGDKTDELEKDKDANLPGEADSDSQIYSEEKDRDLSSSTSGYASSSPSGSPLPEEEAVLISIEEDENISSSRRPEKEPLGVSSSTRQENEPFIQTQKGGAKKAQPTKSKTKKSRLTKDKSELPDKGKTDPEPTPVDKTAADKPVKPKPKQLKKSKK